MPSQSRTSNLTLILFFADVRNIALTPAWMICALRDRVGTANSVPGQQPRWLRRQQRKGRDGSVPLRIYLSRCSSIVVVNSKYSLLLLTTSLVVFIIIIIIYFFASSTGRNVVLCNHLQWLPWDFAHNNGPIVPQHHYLR